MLKERTETFFLGLKCDISIFVMTFPSCATSELYLNSSLQSTEREKNKERKIHWQKKTIKAILG